MLLHSLIFSLPTNCPIWPLWSVFVPTWYFYLPNNCPNLGHHMMYQASASKLQLGEIPSVLHLQNLWLPETKVHFFTKLILYIVLGPVQHEFHYFQTSWRELIMFFLWRKNKESDGIFGNVHYLSKIKSSNFIDRSTNRCQGTAVFWIVEIDKENLQSEVTPTIFKSNQHP